MSDVNIVTTLLKRVSERESGVCARERKKNKNKFLAVSSSSVIVADRSTTSMPLGKNSNQVTNVHQVNRVDEKTKTLTNCIRLEAIHDVVNILIESEYFIFFISHSIVTCSRAIHPENLQSVPLGHLSANRVNSCKSCEEAARGDGSRSPRLYRTGINVHTQHVSHFDDVMLFNLGSHCVSLFLRSILSFPCCLCRAVVSSLWCADST